MNRWRVAVMATLALAPFVFAAPKADDVKETDRIQNAGTVIKEILDVPDDIPQDLLDKARCVIVLPSVLKAAFIGGGSYGRGVMTCRTGKDFTGPWGAPAMYALEGGSIGFQIGGEATDFVILVMNNRGVESLLNSKVQLGGDASIAAGPKGRTASADTRRIHARGTAELFAFPRSVCRRIAARFDAAAGQRRGSQGVWKRRVGGSHHQGIEIQGAGTGTRVVSAIAKSESTIEAVTAETIEQFRERARPWGFALSVF